MIAPITIIDTSIWIDHLGSRQDRVAELLRQRRVLFHPMILGEIALGSIRERALVLAELRVLPCAPIVAHDDVMAMIEAFGLSNSGIGFVDAHLLAAVRLVPEGVILTRDKHLRRVAERLGIAADAD